MNQFVANTGAMNGWQGIVDGVSGDVSNFKNSFSGPSDLASSHGAIGFPVQNAFDGAQSSRDGALGATQAAASRMADLLRQASQAYDRGDLAAAGRLKAQADQIEGASSPASAGGGANAAGAAGGGAGQMMGQFSQMAGQMAQSITQPLQGITQAMTQVPQQVMQGVQSMVEAATQAAGGGGDASAMAANAGADAGGAGAEHAVKADAAGLHSPNDGSDRGPADPHDAKHEDKHDGDRDRPAEAGTINPRQ
ncbi:MULTISPECIES: type VII secretion target [unclassified Mycolicibacterium]|uniref:type VII secretion target n=1 Tax=unclassified Mycolicibacterium TaxID=2636767 RepID=UPI0012DDF5C1|nr:MULTISPECIES: type VII secretion target [unclassified Mycolicibacterium]MUL84975.1 ESX-1 secretion-associated protein [Mycolicibacterium sp. CBMA 329]MUL90942.1 ESX-1 secretion-associated protein [Mycolicibacterium sp. CBMA 331]MUL98387.1 ESX-1 secretion-associated protein [Mycolicibacterium sp. CBMA 334]MUM28561.1 ESX-1 secretion-associated protein [Mycolicibacterium sp. CBMA 295]MUM40701.1 ESX-1 secretion-associated protein [Mycolicibacterium sp. CBMA 247]